MCSFINHRSLTEFVLNKMFQPVEDTYKIYINCTKSTQITNNYISFI